LKTASLVYVHTPHTLPTLHEYSNRTTTLKLKFSETERQGSKFKAPFFFVPRIVTAVPHATRTNGQRAADTFPSTCERAHSKAPIASKASE
jgi:hypothetical protein